MNVEVLTAAMFKTDSLCGDMNLQSDAVIINQCDNDEQHEFLLNENHIRFFSYSERGIGNSRNRALDAARGDILLFADEDIRYRDGYAEILKKAFEEKPDADAFIFNIKLIGGIRREDSVGHSGRLNFCEALPFGAVQLAVRRNSIDGMRFSLYFGGGAKYGSGEDSVFIQDLFKRGLHVYGLPEVLADVNQEESSWFKGYDKKYFFDKGALYAALWGKKAKLLSFAAAARWCMKLKRMDYFSILMQYHKGIDDYNKTIVRNGIRK